MKRTTTFLLCFLFFYLISHSFYGQVGIGTATPKAYFNVAVNKTVLFGLDTVSTGPKLIWYPTKAALRFGQIDPLFDNTAWNYANVGQNSLAFGASTRASGPQSIASGTSSTASGFYSWAHGFAAFASADYALAFGQDAGAAGSFSLSFGPSNRANGFGSISMGNGTYATGTNAAAFGVSTYAKSYGCFVIGRNNDSISTSSNTSWVTTDPVFIIGNGTGSSSRNNAVTVLKNGRMGLGTTAPAFTLEVIGTAAKTGGGSWAVASDARLKKDIQIYTDGLQQILQINPVTFHYNGLNGFNTDEEYVGVLAQELQKVAPYMVNEIQTTKGSANKDYLGSYLNVDPSAFTFMLINAVKKQQTLINQQQKKIDDLERRMKAIENKTN